MSKKTSIAFDVNGTLTIPEVRTLFQCLDKKKCHLIVWSTLGADYAHLFCQKYQLTADEYLAKRVKNVDIAVDDLPETIEVAKLVLGIT